MEGAVVRFRTSPDGQGGENFEESQPDMRDEEHWIKEIDWVKMFNKMNR